MQLNKLSGTSSTTSIYFDMAVQADNAVWGFIPNKQWINILGPNVQLGSTWNSNQGYYVFFPAAQRSNWSTFITTLTNQMITGTNRRFGFFDAQGNGLGFLSVTGSGNSQALSVGNNFKFRNISLNVTAIQGLVSATYDDASSTFKIAKVSSGGTDSVVWTASPGGAGARKIYPLGDLKIPVSGPAPGTLMTDLALSLADQSAFEIGPMYFAPPNNGGGLTALRYPNFIAGGTSDKVSVTTYADPALPLNAKRTYFNLNDKDLKTTFSSSTGRQIILSPLGGSSDPDGISSRFVFSNRPVSQVGDNAAYYLTPYGSFSVGMTGTTDEGELLCAYSATEIFTFSRGDILRFVPGNAAYRVNVPATSDNGPVYLTKDATTSWLGLSTSTAAQNTYYSQPQGSPIYQSSGETGSVGDDGHIAYKLAFQKIPAYPAQNSAVEAEAAATPIPLVPMVPYGGIPTSDKSVVDAYQVMETKGINPQRRLTLKSVSETKSFAPLVDRVGLEDSGTLVNSMTPLGLIGGFVPNTNLWMSTKFAVSGANKDKVLQFEDMDDTLRAALYQNQIFLVIDQNTAGAEKLFTFGDTDATVELSDWFFDLQLQGQDPDGVPPILLLKFFRDKSIKELVDDQSLWEDATTFSSNPSERQTQLKKIIEDAENEGENSVYANFNAVVNDPSFTGLLAINTALKLEDLPPVIRALLGGMTKDDGTSNIAAFRSHHVGVKISDTGNSDKVSLDSSSVFALVDYEDSSKSNTSLSVRTLEPSESLTSGIYGDAAGLDYYGFKVIYLRALFENNALTSFEAEVDLTVNNLFAVGVNLGSSLSSSDEEGDDDNIIKIKGSYSEHDGAQTYSFVAEKTYEFTYENNPYLKNITFDKVQFSATEDTSTGTTGGGSDVGKTSKITSRFAIWGSMEFNKLQFLDMFSFKKLSFADLGIEMSYLLTVYDGGKPPVTSDLSLKFAPGNLRFDFGETEQRTDDDSMLALLPFKLKSFLYSEKGQSISELDYFEISLETLGITPASNPPADSTFNFGLIFDLDLGSLGALVGDLSAFKFSIFLGWQPPSGDKPNALVFGVQMPEADGKLELNIQGVLKISIEQFQLKWTDGEDKLLVLALYNSYMEVLGTRMPPGNIFFDFALFAPTKGENKIGWLAAFNKNAEEEKKALGVSMDSPFDAARKLKAAENGDGDGGSKVFDLEYLGVGQRVGPDENPTNFDEFLEYVRDTFWKAVNSGKYGDVYKPDGGWMVVANFVLLDIVGLGFVFYDSTPFYSLKIYITSDALKGLSFEITYTKVNDNVGLFFINFTLPDTLRTFQAGAASITLPALKLSIYTNSDFKIDLGFPANDDWTVCFRVEAFVGPVPVTGSGGFYMAKLSSATDDTFTNKYDTILAAGFGARLGIGKDFTCGPFKAGVSLTFFGIVEGKLGYYAYQNTEDVVKWLTDPKALSLQGQFGVIGELYGTLDFAIIKASVNVRIQASIGLQLLLQDGVGGDILLYVEASVSVSVSVKIDLGLFSISISFSFRASFRFEWKLLNSGNSNSVEKLLYRAEWAALETTSWNPDYPLQAGLTKDLGAWMTPEITSVWSDPNANGVPWFVVSLTMEYVNDPTTVTDASQFKSFEKLAAQTVAWALNASLGLASWSDTVTQEQIDALNQDPDKLVGGLNYTTLIQGLGKMFTLAIAGLPASDGKTANEAKETKYATIFPMPPFLGLNTTGRSTELNYVFGDKSKVSEQWINTELQEYFEQLYTNITSGEDGENLLAAEDTTIPLIQSLFLDWFQALARSTVNALLTQMQNDESESGKLSDIYLAAVKSGQIRNVAGQMSQFFRSGLRLPQTAGMELPAGSLAPTNPLYALIWQEFPVGTFADGNKYVINLVADQNQGWVSVNATWTLLNSDVTPYQIAGTTVSMPGTPTTIPVLQTGAQAFSLANPITWTPSGGKATTLRPFTKAMSDLLKTSSPLKVKLLSRETTKAYDLDTNPIPTADVRWALSVEMVIRKVPLGGDTYLPNTYALGSADLTVQNAMRDLLTALGGDPTLVKSIKLLYQASSDTSGLISFPITTNPVSGQLFVLRTNTTTQSVPPPSLMATEVETHTTQVGADTSDPFGFLQILEQSSVTNQTGYFLTYETADGKSLPNELFGNQTFAPVTFLFELNVPPASDVFSLASYVNAVVLDNTVEGQLYYAETTEAQNETSYVSIAAGSTGVELTRTEPGVTSVTDKLAQLYSFVAYQVPASTGFVVSNLSVPSGPQKQEETDTVQRWRLSVPLYSLASGNQGSNEPNRYASIGDNYSVQTLVVDAFGNAFGGIQNTISNQPNLYFDDLIPMGNWTGVRSIFNFQAWSSPTDNTVCSALAAGSFAEGTPQANKFSIYLCPSKDALPAPNSQSATATASLYQTIIDQLTPDDVLLFATTNLNSTNSDIDLSADQKKAVLDMLGSVKNYLEGGTVTLSGVTLTVTVPGSSDNLALVFEIQADFGIKRTKNVSPEVADYPNAFRVTTNVPPQSEINLEDLATDFSTAFPAFGLATGPADATDVSVGMPMLEDALEGDATATSQPKGLWAVSKKVTDLTLSNTVRYYLAPKPLDTSLRSGTVDMPNNLNALSSLPKQRTFNDVDLDVFARSAFAAIDTALGAENASNMFRISHDLYSQVAYAREDIADRYADNEVEWLLKDNNFIGNDSDLCQGKDQMAQQMRAALSSAYAVNTIVQTKVTFNQALPSNMGNRLQLFGQMQRPTDGNAAEDAGGFGLGTARVDVPSGGGGQTTTTTFLYGVTDQKIEDNRYEQFPLEWAVSHLQVFLEDRVLDYCQHGEAAPSSIWLQLINSFPSPPKMGDTIIPLAYREYPTPPTMIVQTAKRDTEDAATTLADQTRWIYTSTYQARLSAADEITLNLIYNTGGSTNLVGFNASEDDADPTYTLFEALMRFQSGYDILQPQMSPITENTSVDVLTAFATLVTQLANNSDWMPKSEMFDGYDAPAFTLEQDVVTDRKNENNDERLITLTPDPMVVPPSPWIGDKCITALDPTTMTPYPNEEESCSTSGQKIVTHTYTPVPPLTSNFVTHQVKVKGLTTLLYENGNSGIGVRRNASLYPDDTVFSNPDFIYQTPIVALTNPLTPFVDNPTPIGIYPTVVNQTNLNLGDYIRLTLEAMMGLTEANTELLTQSEGTDALANRRLKIDARYGFPIGSPSGSGDQADYFLPLYPAVLVRSFDLPVDGLQNALKEWVGQSGDAGTGDVKPYAAVLTDWLQSVGLPLGQPTSPDAPPKGAILVFDVTLYSQLSSGSNQLPLLRLSDLRLDLSVVAPGASA